MAQLVNQLTATKVEKEKTPGVYPDGAGLYHAGDRRGREIVDPAVFAKRQGARNGPRFLA